MFRTQSENTRSKLPVCACFIVCLLIGTGAAYADPIIAFEPVTTGYPLGFIYRIGNNFRVGSGPIMILALGVYDEPSVQGLKNPIHVGIFDNTGIGKLLPGGDLWIGPESASRQIGMLRFVDLKSPLILPPGFAGSVVAAGFSNDDPIGLETWGARIDVNGGEGLVRFPDPKGWISYDTDLGTTRAGYTDVDIRYAAGSFQYAAVPEPNSLLLLVTGLSSLFAGLWMRRK